MLIHSVYFWLKRGVTPAQRSRFPAAVRKLSGIPSIKKIYVGPPAVLAERDVTERTFDLALTIVFKDAAGHDTYQVHPLHAAFVKKNKHLWAKVQVFDSDV
jgi:hypothetical protein